MSQVYIRDMLFVNTIEKRLGRKLTEEELDSDEELELIFPTGRREYVYIPRLLFPDDVMSTSACIDLGFSTRDDIGRTGNDPDYMKWYNNVREETVYTPTTTKDLKSKSRAR